jgi:hypothetical protein
MTLAYQGEGIGKSFPVAGNKGHIFSRELKLTIPSIISIY